MNKLKKISYIALMSALSSQSFASGHSADINLLNDRVKALEESLNSSVDVKNEKYAMRSIYSNKLNPSIGVVLNGVYSDFSESSSEFSGFQVDEEGERGDDGFSLGETELNFTSNIDDKFTGSVTAALANEDGSIVVELEEAYIKSTAELGLPTGLGFTAGRALAKIGYLNEHHAHTDDFADRPLPYRVYLNKAYNDDGIQLSYLLPTDFYAEIGGGNFASSDFPASNDDGNSSYTAYLKIGGDIGENQNWLLGVSTLSASAQSGRANEDGITFTGDSDLVIVDFKYIIDLSNSSDDSELILQGEYFTRDESGTYTDTVASVSDVAYDDETSGYYLQAVYKFAPKYRVGFRYSELTTADDVTGLSSSSLNANGFDPSAYAVMFDITNSEFSRIRVQYNNEELSDGVEDDQFMLQYVMSFGAHSAHKY